MSRDYKMTWNAHKGGQWYKKRNGKQHSVSCSTLARDYATLYQTATKEGSYKAANEWWADKVAELDGTTGPRGPLTYSPVFASRMLTTHTAEADTIYDAQTGGRAIHVGGVAEHPVSVHGKDLDTIANYTAGKTTKAKASTLRAGVDRFLAKKRGQVGNGITSGRYAVLATSCDCFAAHVGEASAIASINGATMSDYHAHLLAQIGKGELAPATAASRLSDAKQLVNWLYEVELLPAQPRNLYSVSLRIHVPKAKVKTFTPAEAAQLLADATERTRLYLLLALNCGFTQADIAELQHEEFNSGTGVITHKRVKTKKIEDVPTVKYPLWPETARLLTKHATKGEGFDLLLLNEDGGALKTEKLVGNTNKKVDNIRTRFDAMKTSVKKNGRTFKTLRKTSATLLRDSDWPELRFLWLGHVDKTVADRHYADSPIVRMQRASEWLAKQYGLTTRLEQREAELKAKA